MNLVKALKSVAAFTAANRDNVPVLEYVHVNAERVAATDRYTLGMIQLDGVGEIDNLPTEGLLIHRDVVKQIVALKAKTPFLSVNDDADTLTTFDSAGNVYTFPVYKDGDRVGNYPPVDRLMAKDDEVLPDGGRFATFALDPELLGKFKPATHSVPKKTPLIFRQISANGSANDPQLGRVAFKYGERLKGMICAMRVDTDDPFHRA